MKFWLHKETTYIYLDQLLKALSLANNSFYAKKLIDRGIVKLNGYTEFRRRKMISDGDILQIRDLQVKVLSRDKMKKSTNELPEEFISHGKHNRWSQKKLKR